MKPKIYIDGQAGTTGLQIYQRLGQREDIELLVIDPDKRKDNAERAKLLNEADISFLCLPDAAAREAVSLVNNPKARIIDASTAHRTDPNWDYGFPELSRSRRAAIGRSRRVANPGCHASGFIASVTPLVRLGILPVDYPLTCYSLTGYSGGGKQMIAEYEAEDRPQCLASSRIYATGLRHKHVPEMMEISGLAQAPVFSPVVGDFPQGMATTILLSNRHLRGKPTAMDICEKLQEYYKDEFFLQVAPFGGEEPVIFANTLAGTNFMKLIVCGHEEQTTVTALFDNLGKGASGAAVQNMNIMLGLDEKTGLL
ncbi:MAG: N-acetyl-gamma-glutamyl-phosphate reductase [Oscillospiraceae bacterium]|nr:N-acetyl-gamma-glutamyl-phosphate reductase [Oscillospiraceae bacterium]